MYIFYEMLFMTKNAFAARVRKIGRVRIASDELDGAGVLVRPGVISQGLSWLCRLLRAWIFVGKGRWTRGVWAQL
jgi:hypothetical protein